jgi:hypothetical protein
VKRRVVVNDKMQRAYAYYRTEPAGRNFAAGFAPELTPKQMLRLGVFGGKYMTDCRGEFPASWLYRCEAVCGAAGRAFELVRRQCVAVAPGVAPQRLDSSARSTRLVSVVLPVLHGPPDRGRCAADQALARDCAPRIGHPEALRGR